MSFAQPHRRFKIILLLMVLSFLGFSKKAYPESDNRPAQVILANEFVVTLKLAASYQYRVGDVGIIWRNGIRMAVVKIIKVGPLGVETEIFTKSNESELNPGDTIYFEVRIRSKKRQDQPVGDFSPVIPEQKVTDQEKSDPILTEPSIAHSTSSTLKIDITAQDDQDFVPLLVPLSAPRKKPTVSKSANVFHGRLRARNLYQETNINDVYFFSKN